MNNTAIKPRLLIINLKQYGYSAGHSYYCRYLKNNYNIDFLCLDKGLVKVDEEGINIIYLKPKGNSIWRGFYFTLYAIILTYKHKYNRVFCVYYWFAIFIGIFARTSKSILDIRTGSLMPNRYTRKIINKYIFISSLFFNRITVLSQSLSELLKLPKKQFFLLPLGADKLSITKKEFIRMDLVYVGILNKRKIEITIDAFSKFYARYNENIKMTYTIIGFGMPEEEIIQNKISTYGLEKIVFFIGRKTYNELPTYFDKSNIGICFVPIVDYYQVQPSTKIFEYGLSGMPCIATNTIENSKYINKSNGILCDDTEVDFYNALVKISETRNIYNSTTIVESMKNFEWKHIVTQYLKKVLL
jgi:hypothetical protein